MDGRSYTIAFLLSSSLSRRLSFVQLWYLRHGVLFGRLASCTSPRVSPIVVTTSGFSSRRRVFTAIPAFRWLAWPLLGPTLSLSRCINIEANSWQLTRHSDHDSSIVDLYWDKTVAELIVYHVQLPSKSVHVVHDMGIDRECCSVTC